MNIKIYTGVKLYTLLIAIAVIFSTQTAFGNNRKINFTQSDTIFSHLRNKWKSVLIGSNTNPTDTHYIQKVKDLVSSADKHWQDLKNESLSQNPQPDYLWSDLKSITKSSDMADAYKRIRTMAIAYQTPLAGSKLYHNSALKNDILKATDWMYSHRYYIRQPYNNWFEWEIANPMALNDIMILMYDELSAKQISNWVAVIDHFCPNQAGEDSDYKFWGANRVWRSFVHTIRGIITKNAEKLQLAKEGLSGISDGQDGKRSVFKYVKASDGFYEDGSFIQHYGIAYTGGYGKSLLGNIADLLYMLHGTPWQVTDPESTHVYDWVYKAYQPLIYKHGEFMDMVRGREVSRYGTTDIKASAPAIMAIIRLSQLAPEPHRTNFKSIVKYWISNNYTFYQSFTPDMIGYSKSIMNNSAIKPIQEPVGNYMFAGMDRVVHLRTGWGFGLSMNSTRQSYYECHTFNYENGKAWYTAEGMTYLYQADSLQYADNYWPTVNYYRLPGITVDAGLVRTDQSGYSWNPLTYSSKSWVGGASNGIYGVAGMEQDAWGATLTSKKSWFMFDDELVALGAGISSTDKRPIQTIIENRKLKKPGTNTLTVNGKAQPVVINGEPQTYKRAKWIHLTGNAFNSDIGYYFPQGQTIKALREKRSGKWSVINKFNFPSGDPTYTNTFQELWVEHGENPVNASYSYVLLPNKSVSELIEYVKKPDFTILENSSKVQAVKENKLNIIQANFWNDTLTSVYQHKKKLISSTQKASVVMQQTANEISVFVSDPTWLNQETVELEINQSVEKVIFADKRVKVLQLSPVLKLSINVKDALGKSIQTTLALK